MPLQSQELVDPRKDLLKEVLLRWGSARLQANGTSMLPSLLPYDVVSLVRCSAGDLLLGDLVLCEPADGWLLHRVARLENGWVHTRGDLLFFDQEGKKNSHVGIYLGDGQFVHAPSSGKHVRKDMLDAPYWKKHLSEARRVAA